MDKYFDDLWLFGFYACAEAIFVADYCGAYILGVCQYVCVLSPCHMAVKTCPKRAFESMFLLFVIGYFY